MNFKPIPTTDTPAKSIPLIYLPAAAPPELRSPSRLTARERETLSYLAAGYSSDQIARLLYITKQTVDSHRRNIIKKLGVPNITAAVAHALRHRLIS
ncbi:MAG: helix-turn-helix transcriptional regulator [Bacteroidetes bacterium]|nr:helix-turn-helix transcriptional regulator [Bacteroidota bacterium]